MKTGKWVEYSKKPVGLYMSGDCSGPGWGNKGYYHVVYEVFEKNGTEFRTIVKNGPARRDYGEGYDAAVSLFHIYFLKASGKS
jgi:hypothetical protein